MTSERTKSIVQAIHGWNPFEDGSTPKKPEIDLKSLQVTSDFVTIVSEDAYF